MLCGSSVQRLPDSERAAEAKESEADCLRLSGTNWDTTQGDSAFGTDGEEGFSPHPGLYAA